MATHSRDVGLAPLRRALYRRVLGQIRSSLHRMSEAELLEAVEEPTPAGTVARVLAAAPEAGEAQGDDWAEELLRGAAARQAMIQEAGGCYSPGEVARLLGVAPQAVQQRRRRGTLLGVPLSRGEWGFPACQFGPDGRVLPGVPEVLAAFGDTDPWTILSVLVSPDAPEGGSRPIDRLAEPGGVEAVVELARSYGAQGAA